MKYMISSFHLNVNTDWNYEYIFKYKIFYSFVIFFNFIVHKVTGLLSYKNFIYNFLLLPIMYIYCYDSLYVEKKEAYKNEFENKHLDLFLFLTNAKINQL